MRRTAVVALAVLAGCTSPQIRLDHFVGGKDGSASYTWKLSSKTVIESPTGLTTHRTELQADIKISRRSSGDKTILRVSIRPRRHIEDSIATTSLRPIELTYTLDRSKTAIASTEDSEDQQRSGALVPILGHEFAALATRAVDIGDSWRSDLRLTGTEQLDLEGTSRLDGFRISDRRRNAVVSTTRSGTLATSQPIGRAAAHLTGTLEQRIESQLDLDGGSLTRSDTASRAQLEVTVAGAKQAIVTVTQRSLLRLGAYSSL